jgi:hypothetical protein
MKKNNNKIRLQALLEANKISRLSRQTQNDSLKELKKKYESTKNEKIGLIIEYLTQKQQEADIVAENLVHGGEF